MKLRKEILKGNPDYFEDLIVSIFRHENKAIEALVPLLRKVLEAKWCNKRPPETEDSALYYGWYQWTVEEGKKSGCNVPTYNIFLTYHGSKVRVAQYFGGDRCNSPYRHEGFRYR